MTPKEVSQAADKAGRVPAGREVTRLTPPAATKIRPEVAAVVRARLGVGIRVELADLTPALAASLRHAASMHNHAVLREASTMSPNWPSSGTASPPDSARPRRPNWSRPAQASTSTPPGTPAGKSTPSAATPGPGRAAPARVV